MPKHEQNLKDLKELVNSCYLQISVKKQELAEAIDIYTKALQEYTNAKIKLQEKTS